MILFECNEGEIKRAGFSGDVSSLASEMLLEISTLYGCLCLKNEEAAKTFKQCLLMAMIDAEGQALVFTDAVAKALYKSDDHTFVMSSSADKVEIDADELERQIAEILRRGRKKDESE